MSKYQKIFLYITLVLALPAIYILIRSFFGGLSFTNPLIYYAILITVLHWLFFFIRVKSNNQLKFIIYLPAIFFGIVTLFLGTIAIINSGVSCEASDPGCMNEDYSFVLAVIAFVIMILSFSYSFIFKFFWFKSDIKKIN
ncbi:MAG: hypothetical protein CVV56_07220 [Tenericutes bacterium HGW-Tenericutes-1]|jgi:hypothetical protein|nr:MAG: hypothetical protein CVV56_07220 [Tenericutes bacterium HGW-Tenericutes-1]